MFSNILLATDGSSHAEHALKAAIDLATKYAAELTIVHVLTHDHPSEEMQRMIEIEHLDVNPAPNVDAEEVVSDTRPRGMSRRGDREARIVSIIGDQILKAARLQAEEAGVTGVSTELHDGDYANEILKTAQNKNADVIVMGRRGLSTLQGFMTGSVSHKVSQRANCSVLTVK